MSSHVKETSQQSLLKLPFLASTRASVQTKNTAPAVVMVSKVDHTSIQAKSEISPTTSVISGSTSLQGEFEIYDKEL